LVFGCRNAVAINRQEDVLGRNFWSLKVVAANVDQHVRGFLRSYRCLSENFTFARQKFEAEPEIRRGSFDRAFDGTQQAAVQGNFPMVGPLRHSVLRR
jgi:hypothetical protein